MLFGLLSVFSSSQVWGGMNYYALAVGLFYLVFGILAIVKSRYRDFSEKPFVLILFVVYCIYEVYSFTMLANPTLFAIIVFASAQVFFLLPFIICIIYFKRLKIEIADRNKYGESQDILAAIKKIKEQEEEEKKIGE